MAWNQPDGNGDRDPRDSRDPWGNRGRQQGPPDLDEILRKLQSKWGQVFGRRPLGGGRSGSGGGRGFGRGGYLGIGLLSVVLVVAWWMAGIWIIQEPERGVVLRFGAYHRTIDPGFNWAPYFVDSVITVNVDRVRNAEIGFRNQGTSVAAVPREALMLTEDENIVDLQFAVQYRVKDPAQFLFENSQPEIALRQATESAVREIVGRSTMDFVITEGRGPVAAETQGLIQDILDRYRTGLHVMSVNMQNAQPPGEVQDAFLDAIKAREDQERIINEARAYQADVVPKARGEANAMLAGAEAYRQRVEAVAEGDASRFEQVLQAYRTAPEVTRDRLYLEAKESVLANTSKVLVDIPEGNNIMYLPLDQIVRSRGSASTERRSFGAADDTTTSGTLGEDSRRSRENPLGRTR
ncbi:MAG: FtsH protease activity modulator HflK [Thiotrichales bacterium]|nr:FtsH protease activity modulator HflK [Thiotrichales bacterium]MCY4286167.1 FtsH protease activity modulator HflK [Thiotrichales bacterium]MCY4349937.1 FtsH protease activity modulator HflK [Thiotrichales bacterium]